MLKKKYGKYYTVFLPTEEQLEDIRHLYCNTPISATLIAQRYKVTRNIIIGLAWRKGWVSYYNRNNLRFMYSKTEYRLHTLENKFESVINQL